MIMSVMTKRDIGDYVKACKQKHIKQPTRVVDNLSDGSIYTAKKKKKKNSLYSISMLPKKFFYLRQLFSHAENPML